MHVDHYVEIGLGGVSRVVNAVGGVTLCFDPKVDKVDFPINDKDSHLDVGQTRLQARQRHHGRRVRPDAQGGPRGRHRTRTPAAELIAAVTDKVSDRSLLWKPGKQVALVDAGLGALTVDKSANIVTLARLALAFRDASGKDGVRGTPPISNPDYRPGKVGSTVLLDPKTSPAFFAAVTDGTLKAGTAGGVEG